MANQPDILAGYITQEIVSEFKLGESSENLDRFAAAVSRAISKFLGEDIEVAVGQQITGQGVGEVDDGGGGTTIVNTEVTGKVTTKGGLI